MQKLKDVMTRPVNFVTPDASLKDAAKKMDDINVGACQSARMTTWSA